MWHDTDIDTRNLGTYVIVDTNLNSEDRSNRFSTSFYYPPFQLLLPAMSADGSRPLYFLVDGDRNAYSVNANADWDINELKKAIIHEAGQCLRTSDVILRKKRIFF